MSNSNSEQVHQEFHSYLYKKGLIDVDTVIQPNEVGVYRFAALGETNGSYYFIPHEDDYGNIWGFTWGTWKDEDKKHLWRPSCYRALSKSEQKKTREKVKASSRFKSEERKLKESQAIAGLNNKLSKFKSASEHSYLSSKGVELHPGLKVTPKGELIIPLHNIEDGVSTAQVISSSGRKMLWKGCPAKGAHHIIYGENNNIILVTEGYATAASLFEATSYTAVMAVSAGNLAHVAGLLREKHPDSLIVICADNDQYHDDGKNPGIQFGEQAAKKCGGALVYPEFKSIASKPTDFNDLHQLEGLGAVREQVMEAIENGKTFAPDDNPEVKMLFDSQMFLKDGMLWKIQVKTDGDTPVRVSTYIRVLAITRSAGGAKWGKLIEIIDPDGNKKQVVLPQSLIAGDKNELIKQISNLGVVINLGKHNDVAHYISSALPGDRLTCVEKIGWTDGNYVLPMNSIGPDASSYILQGKESTSQRFKSSGTLDEWKEHVSSLCIGNSRLAFSVSTAFASLLIGLTDEESGGFHFRGGSSSGKTTILYLAKSVCGPPSEICQWRATDNALESIAEAHNHNLLVLDEFGQISELSPKIAGEAIYMLGNGAGKQRSTKFGGVAEMKTWQLLFLSTGEISLSDSLRAAGLNNRAGQEVRFVDVPADPCQNLGVFDTCLHFGGGAELSEAIKLKSNQFYGTAMQQFLECVSENTSEILEQFSSLIRQFMSNLELVDADGQVLRVARKFAIVASAGRLATELNITGWPESEAFDACESCFQGWLSERGGSGAHEESQVLEAARNFIDSWKEARFKDLDDINSSINQELYGYYKQKGDGRNYYLTPGGFEQLCSGLSRRMVIRVLSDKGYLHRTATQPSRVLKLDGDSSRYYHIKPSLFTETESLGDDNSSEECPESSENDSKRENYNL